MTLLTCVVAAAAKATDMLTTPTVAAWTRLDPLIRDGLPMAMQSGTHVVMPPACHGTHLKDGPIPMVNFGPIGFSPCKSAGGTWSGGTTKILIGQSHVDGLKKVTLNVRTDAFQYTGTHPGLHTAAPPGRVLVDIRWAQAFRDSGELLINHCLLCGACDCRLPRTGQRIRPQVHESTAILLRFMDSHIMPSIGALVGLHVRSCALLYHAGSAARGRGVVGHAHPWHRALARAVAIAATVFQRCVERGWAEDGGCADAFWSCVAAMPRHMLRSVDEPFDADIWAAAMKSATTRQGSSQLIVVRPFPLLVCCCMLT